MIRIAAELDVVTGAFSHTGRHIAGRLLDMGRQVRTLTRDPGRASPFGDRVQAFPLRFDRPAELAGSLHGADTLYNTYWIRFAHGALTFEQAVANTEALMRAAAGAGVRRVVQVSITCASPASPLPYFRGKGLAEAAVRASGLSYAIVRPAVIFGPDGIVLHQVAWMLRHLPVFAVFGDGRYRIQPVHVEDLADIAVRAAQAAGDIVMDAVGPETFAFEDLVRRIGAAVGRMPPVVHVPPRLALALGAALGLVIGDVIISWDEIGGLLAGHFPSEDPPTGHRALGAWLAQNAATLGAGPYRSELRKHYR